MTGLTIGKLAEQSGANIETIRFYERIGVLPEPPRSAGGHRIYGAEHLKRLVFVRRCRELGFALDDVREFLRLVDGGTYSCDEVREMTLAHLDSVRARINDLLVMERTLEDMAARCQGGDVPECAIVDALFEASQ